MPRHAKHEALLGDPRRKFGEGRRILSLAFPVSRHPVLDAPGGRLPVTNFIDGLLPEGSLRQQLATVQRVLPDLSGANQALEARIARLSPWGAAAAFVVPAAGALLFSCVGRGQLLYGHPNHDSTAFQSASFL